MQRSSFHIFLKAMSQSHRWGIVCLAIIWMQCTHCESGQGCLVKVPLSIYHCAYSAHHHTQQASQLLLSSSHITRWMYHVKGISVIVEDGWMDGCLTVLFICPSTYLSCQEFLVSGFCNTKVQQPKKMYLLCISDDFEVSNGQAKMINRSLGNWPVCPLWPIQQWGHTVS